MAQVTFSDNCGPRPKGGKPAREPKLKDAENEDEGCEVKDVDARKKNSTEKQVKVSWMKRERGNQRAKPQQRTRRIEQNFIPVSGFR